jgi:hypothetical protein
MISRERKVCIVAATLRSCWQAIKQHPVIATVVVVVLVAGIVFIVAVYNYGWDWTGFNGGYAQVTTHTPTKDTVLPPTKTLWDWLQLLFVPATLTFGVWWLSRLQQQRDQQLADYRAQTEREAAEKRAQTEREIAEDSQQEATLQEYINKMSELLLDEELCEPTAKEEARKVARVRTLTVLPRLNGRRKAIVLRFLYEAQLINKGERVVDLNGADLQNIELAVAELSGVDLRGLTKIS